MKGTHLFYGFVSLLTIIYGLIFYYDTFIVPIWVLFGLYLFSSLVFYILVLDECSNSLYYKNKSTKYNGALFWNLCDICEVMASLSIFNFIIAAIILFNRMLDKYFSVGSERGKY